MINADRLLRNLEELGRIGATPGGGVCRLAASAEDGRARDWFVAQLRAEGFHVSIDAVGNIYGLAELARPGAPLVLTGSHLDSQPSGGRYDGAYGVLGSLEAALAVRGRFARGAKATHNLAVVNWTNEEGARFSPSTLGSAVHAGLVTTEFAQSRTDGEGVSLGDALGAIGYLGSDPPPRGVAAYVELHIEQGPELERAGRTIGVVEGNWGTAKYVADIRGRAAHTGPTPMRERRDALLPAAELVLLIRKLSDETGGALLSSVGRLDVLPNSTNVVPAHVRLFAEFRAEGAAMLAAACERLEARARELSSAAVTIELVRTVDRPAGTFDPALRSLIERTAAECGFSSMRLSTIAGHDAVPMRAACPSAMVFVPSAGGVSHHESEFTRPEDLVAGATVLATTLEHLVRGLTPNPP
jgi:beta-ureidopropionase / N-carbamoyl-L-amino-acid hydrolase